MDDKKAQNINNNSSNTDIKRLSSDQTASDSSLQTSDKNMSGDLGVPSPKTVPSNAPVSTDPIPSTTPSSQFQGVQTNNLPPNLGALKPRPFGKSRLSGGGTPVQKVPPKDPHVENLKLLREYLGEDRVKENESMVNHTTFRIGGQAEFYFEAETID